MTGLQVIDAALDLHLTCCNLFSDQRAILQQEVDAMKHVQLDGSVHDLRLGGVGAQLLGGLLGHVAQTHQQGIQGLGDLWFFAGLGLQIGRSSSLDGSTGRMAKHQHHLGLQGTKAELQAAHNAAFGMGASVARISQDKDVAWHGIKDRLQWSSGICAAQDGSVWGLTLLDQGFPHCWSDLSRNGGTRGETSIALLQQFQCLLGWQGAISRGADRQCLKGWRQAGVGAKNFCLPGGAAQEFHSTSFQVVDATLDFHIASLHQIPQR
mmetsp:Transcript_55877/g.68391  ORF Transcript_55877/g.68391 Transcript_55877/m.68391 type:complete len:266 (+) Transcript_55877:148-945(+)